MIRRMKKVGYFAGIPSRGDWLPVLIPVAIALLSLLMSAYNGYTRNDKTVERRLTIVETKQSDDGARLERIENKLDVLIREVKPR